MIEMIAAPATTDAAVAATAVVVIVVPKTVKLHPPTPTNPQHVPSPQDNAQQLILFSSLPPCSCPEILERNIVREK